MKKKLLLGLILIFCKLNSMNDQAAHDGVQDSVPNMQGHTDTDQHTMVIPVQIIKGPIIIWYASIGSDKSLESLLNQYPENQIHYVLDVQMEENTCALHLAALNGHENCVKLLLARGAKVNLRTLSKQTALHFAAKNGHHKCVALLLKHNAEVDCVDDKALTPLHLACRNGNKKSVLQLLKKGASVNALDDQKFMALHFVAIGGHDKLVDLLVQYQAQINMEGTTPLHLAASYGKLGCVTKFIALGADIHAIDTQGATPIILAAFTGHADCLAYLIEKGAQINAPFNNSTAFLLAALNGHLECVTLLHAKGADIHAEHGESKNTALHMVVMKNSVELLKFLIALKLDINAQNKSLSTPLHFASFKGHPEAAYILLTSGADPRIGMERGAWASDISSDEGCFSLYNLLRAYEDDTVESLEKKIDHHTVCLICREEFVHKQLIYNLSCGHIFHARCLKSWDEATCPFCRAKSNIESEDMTGRRLLIAHLQVD